MANIVLDTSAKLIGSIAVAEGNGTEDRYFKVNAYYTKKNATQAYVYVQLLFRSWFDSVSGSGTVTINNKSQDFSFNSNEAFTADPLTISYDATTGQSKNNSLTVALSNMSAVWDVDGSGFDANPLNDVRITYDLPNIDPSPTITSASSTVQKNDYNGLAVASISTVRFTTTVRYAKSATLTVTGAGVTNTYTIKVTKASSETKYVDFLVPASASNYTLKMSLKITNDTGSATDNVTRTAYGYSLPTYANTTYTTRCNSSGTPNSQGSYGRLYLTWVVSAVDSSDKNTLQTCKVQLNGKTITATSGSIASGYLNFIFPLSVNTQGNLTVIFTDRISQNTITSLVVPKSIMPLSLYQSGDSVGVAIGRMATESGFWCYEEFYLKGQNHTTVYNIGVDSNGVLNVDGNPIAYTSGSSI